MITKRELIKIMLTNRELINAMSKEEFADLVSTFTNCEKCFLNGLCETDKGCKETFYKWLERELPLAKARSF